MADKSSSTGSASSRGYTADSSRHARFASIPEDAALPSQHVQKPAPRPWDAVPAQETPRADKLGQSVEEATDAEAADGFAKWAAPLQYFRMPHVRYASEIGTGTWLDLCHAIMIVLSTPTAFATLPFALARLTWVFGLVLIFTMWAASYYNTLLLAELHQWTVTMRFCRFRDLAKSIWGPKGFYLAFIFQQFGVISNNVALQLASGLVLKDLYDGYHPQGPAVSLFWFIAAYGIFELLLCQAPTLRHLHRLNAVTAIATLAWVGITIAGCIVNGRSLDRSNVSFDFPPGPPLPRTMKGFAAVGAIAYAFSNPMFPELQSIVPPPAIKNGRRGASAAFAIILGMYVGVACAGYWAYGNGVSNLVVISLLLQNSALATVSEVLLVVLGAVNFQLYGRVTLEVIDYMLQDPLDDNLMSMKACVSRLGGSLVYILTVSFVASMLPTALDEISVIVGVFGFVPLCLVMPLLMYNTARKPGTVRRYLHILMAAVSVIVAVAAMVGAAYNLAVEIQTDGIQVFGNIDPADELGDAMLDVAPTGR